MTEEQVAQAVADIEWLRAHDTPCGWQEATEAGDRLYREHVVFGFAGTHTNLGADAYVAERHLRMDRADRIDRLAELDKTHDGREILREAFRIANMS